ncbi:DVU_1551 family NTP transferase [Desulfomicrobium baculatum]|uniref:Metal dependent phosphohydrolase n=1 Tax=Desulfomicrobium baculatum (strain DSM 4028 / VKM B-1378 / X) TaxID=525897 RepID=C7LUB2_DESBD|nr:NTP transferase domain-containing protein [Desulfomicrobium baculatum]ACU89647.1 metal dependent phosphohydrolase [Desulfomicrobium baculatum DSM 4028]
MTLVGPRFAAVILSAGLSSRMGDFKPLMDLAGQTVLARCVRTFRDAGIAKIVVVIGHRASEVQVEVERFGVSTIHNPVFEQGMFSSVRAAVASLAGLDAFFLLPVDIPLVRPATVDSLVQAYDGRIAYPCFRGERGHPPLIPTRLIQAILGHDGKGGMKSLLEGHPSLDVPVWDQGVLLDADTPDDFAALVCRATRLVVGTRAEAALLAAMVMPERGVAHGRAAASVAVRLGEEVNRHGGALDLDLIHNAALLHDIGKGQPNHEACGGELLAGLGLHGLAGIVASHRDVPPPLSGVLTEKEVVCLADKLVRGSQRISVQERFAEKLALYSLDAHACLAIRGRMNNALALRGLVERFCGRDIEEILDGVLP